MGCRARGALCILDEVVALGILCSSGEAHIKGQPLFL
jgi:hypothetical protein